MRLPRVRAALRRIRFNKPLEKGHVDIDPNVLVVGGGIAGIHAALTLATDLPVYFAAPHSPWQRPSNENTNGLIREYLPKGEPIPAHQPYLTAIAEELKERPRATLGYLTPRESFQRLLLGRSPVATTA